MWVYFWALYYVPLIYKYILQISLYFDYYQFSSVTQSCPTLCNPMNRSTPGLPVYHQLPEFTQTHALDSYILVVLSEVLEGYASCFLLFSKDYFCNSGSFVALCKNFKIISSSSVKNVMDNLLEITLNL